MNENTLEILAYLAGAFCLTSFIPQIVTSFKRKTQKLNPLFLIILLIGMVFWVVYGVLLFLEDKDNTQGVGIIVSSSLQCIGILIILYAYFRTQ